MKNLRSKIKVLLEHLGKSARTGKPVSSIGGDAHKANKSKIEKYIKAFARSSKPVESNPSSIELLSDMIETYDKDLTSAKNYIQQLEHQVTNLNKEVDYLRDSLRSI